MTTLPPFFTLDDAGEPVPQDSFLVWTFWFAVNFEKRVLAKDQVGDSEVSTVFIGLDYGASEGRVPLLWETLIIGGEHNGDKAKYATKAEALVGHTHVVEMLRCRLCRN